MTMYKSMTAFCEEKAGEEAKDWGKEEVLKFIEGQWGHFMAWMREKYPVHVRIEVRGGVAEDMGNHPGAEVEIIDHD